MDTARRDSINVNYTLTVINRKKWLIICCVIGALIPIIIYNYISKNIYEATTMIIYEDHSQALPLTSAFKTRFGGDIINDQIKEIKSYSLSKDVFNNLPRSIIETYPLLKRRKPDFDIEDFITKQIQKRISTNSSINSNVIEIKVEAFTAQAASGVANTLTDVLINRNLKVRRHATSSVRKMIEEQLKVFEEQLQNSEIILKNFKETGQITYVEKESEEIFRRITEAEVMYNRTKALFDATQKRYAVIQKKLAYERKDLVPSITKVTSPWAQKLKESLIDLEVQYTDLKVQNYSEDHPKLKKIKRQIEQTKQTLKEETLKITQGENIVDPLSQIENFLKELISLDIELETYKAQKDALEKIIDTYNKHLISVPAKEMQLAQLTREMEVNNQIYKTLLQKREEAKIADAEKTGNIRIIDPAVLPIKPTKPRKLLNIFAGFLIGTMLGVGLALLLEQMDDTIKTVRDFEKSVEFSVLGSIPTANFKHISINNYYKKTKKKTKKGVEDERYKLINNHINMSQFVESFRSLRTSIQLLGTDMPIKSIIITSPNPQEGKSVIAANLAISMAQTGLKILLIDGDLRKPVQHILFAKRKSPGLTDYLLIEESQFKNKQANNEITQLFNGNSENIENSTLFSSLVTQTDIDNLTLLTSGKKPLDSSAIISSNCIKTLIDKLITKYDLIIIDSPPVLPVTDAIVLSQIINGVLFVVKSGRSNRDEIVRASTLVRNRGKIIGGVLNNIELGSNSHYYFNEKSKKIRKQKEIV